MTITIKNCLLRIREFVLTMYRMITLLVCIPDPAISCLTIPQKQSIVRTLKYCLHWMSLERVALDKNRVFTRLGEVELLVKDYKLGLNKLYHLNKLGNVFPVIQEPKQSPSRNHNLQQSANVGSVFNSEFSPIKYKLTDCGRRDAVSHRIRDNKYLDAQSTQRKITGAVNTYQSLSPDDKLSQFKHHFNSHRNSVAEHVSTHEGYINSPGSIVRRDKKITVRQIVNNNQRININNRLERVVTDSHQADEMSDEKTSIIVGAPISFPFKPKPVVDRVNNPKSISLKERTKQDFAIQNLIAREEVQDQKVMNLIVSHHSIQSGAKSSTISHKRPSGILEQLSDVKMAVGTALIPQGYELNRYSERLKIEKPVQIRRKSEYRRNTPIRTKPLPTEQKHNNSEKNQEPVIIKDHQFEKDHHEAAAEIQNSPSKHRYLKKGENLKYLMASYLLKENGDTLDSQAIKEGVHKLKSIFIGPVNGIKPENNFNFMKKYTNSTIAPRPTPMMENSFDSSGKVIDKSVSDTQINKISAGQEHRKHTQLDMGWENQQFKGWDEQEGKEEQFFQTPSI